MNYSRWTTSEELLEILTKVNKKEEVKKSGIPYTYDDENLYINSNAAHTAVIGSTGSGKTQTTVLPQMRLAIRAGESLILHDIDGETYSVISKDLEKEKYNTIVINLNEPDKGNKFNPFALPYKLYKDGNKDEAMDLIENIGYYLFEVEYKTSNTDPFWTNSAVSLFTGLTLYLFDKGEKDVTISKIVSLFDDLDSIDLSKFDKSNPIYVNLSGVIKAPSETRGSIIAVAKQSLKLFVTREKLNLLLSKSDFDIEKVQEEKTALIIISSDKASSKRISSLIIDQVYNACIMKSSDRLLNVLIDEYDATFPIKSFASLLTVSRSKNIRTTIYIKSVSDIKSKYDATEYEVLKMCFGNIIYLLSSDLKTLEGISKLCGDKKENNEVEPLISVQELKLLKSFEAIILVPRMNPIRTKLIPDYKIDW